MILDGQNFYKNFLPFYVHFDRIIVKHLVADE